MPITPKAVGTVTVDHEVTVDRSQLRLFAKATGSQQPTMINVEAAQQAGLPDLPIPPTFLFGLELMKDEPYAWLDDLGIDLLRVLHGSQSFEFHEPAHAGDRLRVRGVVTGVSEKKGGTLEFIDRTCEITREGMPIATLMQTLVVRNPETAG